MEQSTHEIRVKEWSKIIQDCYTSGLTKKNGVCKIILMKNCFINGGV